MANINPLAYTGRVVASTKRLGDAEFNPDSFSVSENGVVSIAGELVDITLIAAPAGQDLDIKMGDAAGANKISFLDSASVEVASLDSNGVFVAPQVNSLIFDTNVAAAGVTLQGTTLAADGTDANISITLTPKGSGIVAVDNLGLDGNTISSTNANGDINLDPNGTGNVVITSGNLSATAGHVIIAGAGKQLQVEGGAVTDFIGQATLVAGTVTVLNTNIAAGDKILVSRRGINGSIALGVFDVAITAATSFSITSRKSDATTETNDTSIVDYFIVRQV